MQKMRYKDPTENSEKGKNLLTEDKQEMQEFLMFDHGVEEAVRCTFWSNETGKLFKSDVKRFL